MSKSQKDNWKYILSVSASSRHSSLPLFIVRRPISIDVASEIIDYGLNIIDHEINKMSLDISDVVLFLKIYDINKKHNLLNTKFYGTGRKIYDLVDDCAQMV